MTIVVGYIPNEYGEAALAAGIEEARRRGTGIVVVNSTRGDTLVDPSYVGERQVVALEQRLAGIDVPYEFRQPMGADVAEEIVGVARETGAELIVIGLRHRSPVGKMLMGSVAQQVLLGAEGPVLAVKPER
jgi:nucleotide-binding universal stress UspA family protein